MSRSFGSIILVVAALGSALGCYTLSLKVSAERAAVDKLRIGMVADAQDIRMLRSELLIRARLPELQRWNDTVLQLSAPTERQFVRDPVQLAAYAVKPGVPRVTLVASSTARSVAPVAQSVARLSEATPTAQAKAPAVASTASKPAPRVAPVQNTHPLAAGLRQIAFTVPSAASARAPRTPGLDAAAVESIEALAAAGSAQIVAPKAAPAKVAAAAGSNAVLNAARSPTP